MRLSKYYLPTLNQVSSDLVIPSHEYSVRCGLIKQSNSGLYSWLPMGLKVLKNIKNIVRDEMDKSGALEMTMPCLQPSELWKKSGRYNDYGSEMLRIKDRGNRELIFGPTNEEMITDLVGNTLGGQKKLPLILYQIQWKFRDEIRPRSGLMRSREFLLKDAYSFDLDANGTRVSYMLMYETYLRIFHRLGLNVLPVKADAGPIGGEMSHEFHVLSDSGESTIYYDSSIDLNEISSVPDSVYAATDDVHDHSDYSGDVQKSRGIEVGHLFNFGTKYSEPMNSGVQSSDNQYKHFSMGSYGIGLSRLVAAIIEAHHDDKGIIWPSTISPFSFAIINLTSKSSSIAERIYSILGDFNVLFDDTDDSIGTKLRRMDLIGLPYSIVVGKNTLENGIVEIRSRKSSFIEKISMYNILNIIEDIESGNGRCYV